MKNNLNEENSKQYLKIVTEGNYDDMFDFAYAIGWKEAMRKMLEETEKMKETTKQLNNKFKEVQSIVIMFDYETTHADVIQQFVNKLSDAWKVSKEEIIENMEMVKILLDIK